MLGVTGACPLISLLSRLCETLIASANSLILTPRCLRNSSCRMVPGVVGRRSYFSPTMLSFMAITVDTKLPNCRFGVFFASLVMRLRLILHFAP